MMGVGSYKSFLHVSKMPTLAYNWANSIVIKNDVILNIIHNIFNLRDTGVVICIILVLVKRANAVCYLTK